MAFVASFEGPSFTVPITNVTIPMGREAVLTCVVANLSIYKVAWLRVDTQTILTIANHVITKNHRIGVTHTERKTWHLHIRDVTESDRGAYMCQINTDPMKSQTGYLDVVVPPDILDYMTSTDMIIREGSNVTLRCAAKGSPTPSITWRREGGESIFLENGEEVKIVEGSIFNITKINRLQMGAYLCIASNGIPPTVSKRIMLTVQFSPMISIQNQLVGAQEGQRMTLECNSEAFPQLINYWTKENNEIIENGDKYNQSFTNNVYKVHMKLTILATEMSDYGTYKCISKNSLGETDGSIKLYHIPTPTTQPRTTTTTTPVPTTTNEEVENIQNSRQRPEPSADPGAYQITDSSLPNIEHRTDDIHLHGRASSNSYNDVENVITINERKSIDNEIRPRRIDNTAQSMSSRDSNSNFQVQTTTAICIILLSALS
ncbi:neurotrimin isoform X2 [Apis mellifera]|uniref:Neurotrimin isoform X2 n=1 Tax=Apis mellifera TaxID=7460 RepID=A0A7M7R8M5_APIME|nr:neurotrimin isoform X2 [Apis mellifera]|eukprot:XP_397461.3 neurotrimin isoform X2 [Apis mellifera]